MRVDIKLEMLFILFRHFTSSQSPPYQIISLPCDNVSHSNGFEARRTKTINFSQDLVLVAVVTEEEEMNICSTEL